MGATPQNVWSVPAYLPYIQPKLTAQAVLEAETKLGVKLPKTFIDLLKAQNGGYIRFRLPDVPHEKIAGIGPHFPSLVDFDWTDCQEYVGVQLEGLVPFDGDGHWHLCLDYRTQNSEPKITYVDVECDHEEPVAKDFADYLGMLELETDGEYVIEKPLDIGQIKAGISKALGVVFAEDDMMWEYGYPVHRAALGDESDPQWLWISPNNVPRGFDRPQDERYGELKSLMPGMAARFPEAPAEAYLLKITEDENARALEACARAGIIVRAARDYIKPK